MRSKEEIEKEWQKYDIESGLEDYEMGISDAFMFVLNILDNFTEQDVKRELETLEGVYPYKSEFYVMGYTHALEWILNKRTTFVFR